MSDPDPAAEPTPRHGVPPDELERIRRILGREPNPTELGVFSVMWSEHCSYKSTRIHLRKFPTTGPGVLVRAGEENAGVLDIGDGWAIAFKIESHNHPSAIEPFEGAATGVGGILRDIFTMGARPVLLLDSLRFGPITGPGDRARLRRNRALFAGVVAGIAHYGNCVGVPTLGGELCFDESYEGNPLVNVFCLGALRHDEIARGAAHGPGNPVFYVGAETGRDGLAGAAFASRELTDESREDRPAVQVGDPFKEKLLLEACLELLASGAVAGIQDMGAAGLACSTSETASRGGTGLEIDVALVPCREPGMTPREILLSESQERMLVIARRGHEETVRRIFDKWDLAHARIGEVTGDGLLRVRERGRVVAEIPAAALAADAPVYDLPTRPIAPASEIDPASVPPCDPARVLPRLLSDPTLASKRWVYRQYDHQVGGGTVVTPGSDAAVFWLRDAGKFLAVTADCNALYCRSAPRDGARIAVAEAARNLACSGARPLGLTDNLNFGNPHNPENLWCLVEAIEGMAEACRAFGTPVTGGNVSLYNQSPESAIDPTPTVAMVGLIERREEITAQGFRHENDVILLLGGIGSEIGASHYLKICHGRKEGRPPRLDLQRELALDRFLLDLIRRGIVGSAHDCSEGGLGVALAECCLTGAPPIGAAIDLGDPEVRPDVALFNETQARVILSLEPDSIQHALALARAAGVDARPIGTVGGDRLEIRIGQSAFAWDLRTLHDAWENAIPECMAEE